MEFDIVQKVNWGIYQGQFKESYLSDEHKVMTSPMQVRIQGGGPGGPGPPLTPGFEAPKLSIFGPYLIFP